MASIIVHPFVALAAAPYFRRCAITPAVWALGAAFTIVPDLDVIGLRFGVPYESLFGHRGFSHSLFFAAALAAMTAIGLRAAGQRAPATATFAYLFLCAASHGLLDALTDGGLGVAFFSPLSNERYFLPWRVLSVSPLSVSEFLSGRAWPILSSEFRWVVLPCLLLALVGHLAARRQARLQPGRSPRRV
jgi:inner membrane protein